MGLTDNASHPGVEFRRGKQPLRPLAASAHKNAPYAKGNCRKGVLISTPTSTLVGPTIPRAPQIGTLGTTGLAVHGAGD